MDWECYKALCDSPHYWSRWMLARSAELIERAAQDAQFAANTTDSAALRVLARTLRAAYAGRALTKPNDHRGPPATDMFPLELSTAQAALVRATVAAAAAADWHTASGRSLAGFVAAWDEYLGWLLRGTGPDDAHQTRE